MFKLLPMTEEDALLRSSNEAITRGCTGVTDLWWQFAVTYCGMGLIIPELDIPTLSVEEQAQLIDYTPECGSIG